MEGDTKLALQELPAYRKSISDLLFFACFLLSIGSRNVFRVKSLCQAVSGEGKIESFPQKQNKKTPQSMLENMD